MNQINPKKLLHSKWTALTPINKAKHFMVIEVEFSEENEVIDCVLQAVLTKHTESIDWQDLKESNKWKHGWK
jgi:tryptophan-rich hypothetical protein